MNNNIREIDNKSEEVYSNWFGSKKSTTPKPAKPAKVPLTEAERAARTAKLKSVLDSATAIGASAAQLADIVKKNKAANAVVDSTPSYTSPTSTSDDTPPSKTPDDKILGMPKMVFFGIVGLLVIGGGIFAYKKFKGK